MAEIQKVDLRKVPKGNSDRWLTPEQATAIQQEILSYGVGIEIMELDSKTIYLKGYDNKGHEITSEVDARDYLSSARKISRMSKRVEKYREKFDIDSYGTIPLDQLIYRETADKQGIKGYKNYESTLNKILKRDSETKRNRLEEAEYNRDELRKVKFAAYDNVDELLEKADPNYKRSDYYKKNGEFKSEKKRKELMRKFAHEVTEDYDTDSEYYGWLYEKYGKNWRRVLTKQTHGEQIGDYVEFAQEKLSEIKDLEGAEERYNYEIDDEDIEKMLTSLKNRKGGK